MRGCELTLRRFAVFLSLLVAVSASAGVDTSFVAGETLDFNLSWSKIAGGSARMTIAPSGDARYRITSVGRSSAFFSRIFKVRDEIESVVTRDSFTTVQYRKILDERGKTKDELTTIEGIAAVRKGKTVAVPAPVFDPLSLMYYIRRLDLATGAKHEFTVIADGKVYTLEARVVRRETITTPAGRFATVLVEPKRIAGGTNRGENHQLLIWYSDDERRLPVRIRSEVNVGSITATLRSVHSGVESTEPVMIGSEVK